MLSGPAGVWQRPAVNAAAAHEVRLPLSGRSRDALGHYLAALRPDRLPVQP
ncbi:hypothetical protein [Streptomyces apocyni]|uniref:hypothetical protein n=1 Tax=Streptomyces apocyni TaxID=2654677 RepID=UPI0012E9B626|nr:hypothetical protein [Streptomyces apocyni]